MVKSLLLGIAGESAISEGAGLGVSVETILEFGLPAHRRLDST